MPKNISRKRWVQYFKRRATFLRAIVSRFPYEPLEPNQIRILQLAPGRRGDPLVGELLLANIDDQSLVYDALSYLWGDPAPTDAITLSGRALPIASNLSKALQYLRYTEKTLIIWIDAICINQQDIVERAEQVQLMRHLYSGASTVRIWINEPRIDENSEAVKALQNFDQTVKKYDKDDVHKALGDDASLWFHLVPLFKNNYWARVWVQQEVLNARQLMLHCLDTIISGDSLAHFQSANRNLRISLSDDPVSPNTTWKEVSEQISHHMTMASQDVLEYREGRQYQDLHDILHYSHFLQTTDPRDLIYALMHLAKDYEDDGIMVDYSKSAVDVAIDAASYHTKKHQNLIFLKDVCLADHTQDSPEGHIRNPTWLSPIWYGEKTSWSLNMIGSTYPDLTKTFCFPTPIMEANRRIQVRGVRVDQISSSLTQGFDSDLMVQQFWESSLGSWLKQNAGTGMAELPSDASKVLCGFSVEDLDSLRDGLKVKLQDVQPGLEQAIYESAKSGLLALAQQQHADQRIYENPKLRADLLPDIGYVGIVILHVMFDRLQLWWIILTEKNYLGRIPGCAIKPGDEVWVILGCDLPLVLRPKPNGTFWHVCAAEIASIQEHTDIRSLTSDSQLGDRIGEWVVEDIEIS